MSVYTFTSERAITRTITTLEEAKNVIIATATSRMHDKEALLNDKDIQEVASAFHIDLEKIIVTPTVDPDDFPFDYRF